MKSRNTICEKDIWKQKCTKRESEHRATWVLDLIHISRAFDSQVAEQFNSRRPSLCMTWPQSIVIHIEYGLSSAVDIRGRKSSVVCPTSNVLIYEHHLRQWHGRHLIFVSPPTSMLLGHSLLPPVHTVSTHILRILIFIFVEFNQFNIVFGAPNFVDNKCRVRRALTKLNYRISSNAAHPARS